MKKFRRFAILVLITEIILIIAANIIWNTVGNETDGKMYRVEASRIARELENTPLESLKLDEYPTIIRVSVFDPSEICKNDYLVMEIGDVLYRFEYKVAGNRNAALFINASLFILLAGSLILFIYIDRKVLKPFAAMDVLTVDLAKGNLSKPVKAEKSRYFGRFMWGIDMLREKLESNRVREIELQRDQKTLILSLSHDIKTPLSAIELYEKALAENLYESEEKRLEALEAIKDNAEEIRKYVSQISTAAREDFLDLDVNMTEVYLSSVIEKIRAFYSDKLSVLHTDFTIGQYTDCLIKGDGDRIIEVLQNIMENAIKYGDGVEIKIFFDEEEDCRLIHIENSGNSLKADELPSIFDSFFRGSNSHGKKGSGLGLFISRKLMRQMEGDLYAEADENSFRAVAVLRKA